MEVLTESCPLCLIGLMEQERRKPKDRGKRRAFYSARRKRHTLKTQVVVGKEEDLIRDVSPGWERVKVEHTILAIKRYQAMGGIYPRE